MQIGSSGIGVIDMQVSSASPQIVASDGTQNVMLRCLSLSQLRRIDHLLEQIGDYGEVRLIVEKGTVKFVEIVVSKRL